MTRRTYSLRMEGAAGLRHDYAAELNEQQLAAVRAENGPALVIAGAGSGKTRTLTYRVAWLLEHGVPPSGILLLTFTNKAAREMLDRVTNLVPQLAHGIWGGTFHSFGNRILRHHAEAIGYQRGFSIIDSEDQEELIEAVVERTGAPAANARFPKARVLAEIFGLCVNTGSAIGKIIADRFRYFYPFAESIEQVWIKYQSRKREANVMDFDDLLARLLELFQLAPEILSYYQDQFQYVLVDEYQDTNWVQSELVYLLTSKSRNVMVVGDDSQAIYSWRGATADNILAFPKKFPGAEIYKIESNYRSTPEILALANESIRHNQNQYEKELHAVRKSEGLKPALVPTSTNNEQAAFVAQRILELIDEKGYELGDIAVLYRAHFHSLEVQLELTKRGIPFAITSGIRFFEQAHVKDVAAFMRFAVNPSDEVSFKRMVKLLPGIGKKTAEGLWHKAVGLLDRTTNFSALHSVSVPTKAKTAWGQLVHTLEELVVDGHRVPPGEMIQSILFAIYDDYMKTEFANYDARREDLLTLANYAAGFEDADEFLAQLALLGALETEDAITPRGENDRVVLSTVHQAKGLEWKAVFLVWLTDGMFPNAKAVEASNSLDEERRLFYVGVTRCKDELYLVYPDRRVNVSALDSMQRPSRFLSELNEDRFDYWDIKPNYDQGLEGEIPF